MPVLFHELSAAAQTAYAELFEQARVTELSSLSGLTGAFHRRVIRGHAYYYFGYRDPIDGAQRRVYVGPADARVEALVARFGEVKAPKRMAPLAQSAQLLGCTGTPSKHYRIIRQEGVRDFVCVRHSMTERSDYANEEEDNEGGGSRGGGDAVDPQGAD
jgi:hypothetical protein